MSLNQRCLFNYFAQYGQWGNRHGILGFLPDAALLLGFPYRFFTSFRLNAEKTDQFGDKNARCKLVPVYRFLRRIDRLKEAAVNLEAHFLAEMLKSAGVGEARNEFGGGAGEEQFASFLRQEQAHAMARSGGIGLAEMLFISLKERSNDE